MKKIYIILITIIGITVVIITSCILSIYIGDSKNEDNTLQFQNQFLKDFGIDFMETKHKKDSFIQNEFGVFFEIELSQTERIQMDRYVKADILDTVEHSISCRHIFILYYTCMVKIYGCICC